MASAPFGRTWHRSPVTFTLYGGVRAVVLEGLARSATRSPSPSQLPRRPRGRPAFLGVACRRSGESRRLHPSKRHPTSPGRFRHAIFITPRPHQFGGGRAFGRVGLPAFVRQTMSMLSKACMCPPHNLSVNTDAHGRPLPSVAPGVRRLRQR